MTQQEQQLLKGLTDRVNGTTLQNKDADAEQALRGALGSNPDALYILCQTVLMQQFALDNSGRQLAEARAEVQRLQQAQKPQEHGSFLGNLFGLGKSDDAPQPAAAPAQGATGYAPVHNPGMPSQQGYGQPLPQQTGYGQPMPQAGYGYGQPGVPYGYSAAPAGGGLFSGGGGFLQGAAQTAAGVVAGEFAFRALEDVFRGGGGRGFGGTEVVNNYYDDSGDRGPGDGFADRLQAADGLDGSISPDIEDRRGDASGFLGGGNDDTFSAGSDGDDSSNDDSGGDSDYGGDDFSSDDSGGSSDGF